MTDPTTQDTDTVTVLLVGDPGCGKSTFLSRLKNSPAGSRRPPPSNTATTITPKSQTDLLRDGDQPFIYDVRFTRKSFTLEIYDTASPNQHWSTLQPQVVVLAFDISNRETLDGLKGWRHDITRYFQHGHGEILPVMMLGLKRDLRVEGEGIIYPQETYRMAQELCCDQYAECSAVTGELVRETFEDLARLAAMTRTKTGAQGEGGCLIL